MRKLFFSISLLTALLWSALANAGMIKDTVSMGASYANDVFYSLDSGFVSASPRNNWDVAFPTSTLNASIRINDGNGVMLYNYPKSDTSGWSTFDTTGLSAWKALYNSDTVWDGGGAFEVTALGHPDYGWGIYNTFTHKIHGDSLYLIKLADGSFRKLWIIEKDAPANKTYFRYAMLNGSSDTTISLDCAPYSTKNYVGYSFGIHSVADREPDAYSWDLLFTKYIAEVAPGSPYGVTGVLTNAYTLSSRLENADTSTTDWNSTPLLSSISTIGYDWKEFSMSTFTYVCDDSMVFFAQSQNLNVYKLVFETFAGSSTGNIIFRKELMSPVGVDENNRDVKLYVYPNPASDQLNIMLSLQMPGEYQVQLFDMNGRLVVDELYSKAPGLQVSALDIHTLIPGMYILNVSGADFSFSEPVVIE